MTLDEDRRVPDRGEDIPTTDAVLTREEDGDAPAAMGPVITMEVVQRYVEAERNRHKRVLLFTSVGSLFFVLLVLVLFVSIGIFVLANSRRAAEIAEGVEDRTAAFVSEVVDISDDLDTLARKHDDVAEAFDNTVSVQTRNRVRLQTDLKRFSDWIASQHTSTEESYQALEYRLRQVEAAAALREKELLAKLDRYERLAARREAAADDNRAGGEIRSESTSTEEPTAVEPGPEDMTVPEINVPEVRVAAIKAPDRRDRARDTSTVKFPNGDSYEGEFENGLFHGYGVYTSSNGDRYEGQFREDVMSGQGTMIYKNGNKYVGHFLNGKRNGLGELTYSNGDIYRGEFRDDRRTGEGTYVFSNGSRYEGEFLDGRRHGKGRYVYPSGDEYRGYFSNGKMDGVGICTYSNGQIIKGLWKSGRMVKRLDKDS